MKKFVSVLLVLLACIIFSGVAHAGSITTNLQVSVNVIPACLVNTSPVNFGDVGADNDWHYANGDVQVHCPLGIPYNITLDAGQNFDGVGWRRVTDGVGDFIKYSLAQDSSFTGWGDYDFANTYPAYSLADTGNGLSQPHTVYSRMLVVPTGTPVGYYSDNVVVTVYF